MSGLSGQLPGVPGVPGIPRRGGGAPMGIGRGGGITPHWCNYNFSLFIDTGGIICTMWFHFQVARIQQQCCYA